MQEMFVVLNNYVPKIAKKAFSKSTKAVWKAFTLSIKTTLFIMTLVLVFEWNVQ